MIKIENIKTCGWEPAIKGMRNPKKSLGKMDSKFDGNKMRLGQNDEELMKRLVASGSSHAKFRRMISVYMDITAPLYWWKEFDTYKVGTVSNSESTMHTIHQKEFELDDFSYDHLKVFSDEESAIDFKKILIDTITFLNIARSLYIQTKLKDYWWQMIQLLPTSYNQKRTVMVNYETLNRIYKDRKNHKLNEWIDFCKIIRDELNDSWVFTEEF